MAALGRIAKGQDTLHRSARCADGGHFPSLMSFPSQISIPPPSALIQSALEVFDDTVREAVSDIMECPLSYRVLLKGSSSSLCSQISGKLLSMPRLPLLGASLSLSSSFLTLCKDAAALSQHHQCLGPGCHQT